MKKMGAFEIPAELFPLPQHFSPLILQPYPKIIKVDHKLILKRSCPLINTVGQKIPEGSHQHDPDE